MYPNVPSSTIYNSQDKKTDEWIKKMCVYMCVYIYTAAAAAKSLQSCPTLCDPIDGSPPGSSVHGIFQARVLE